MLKRSLTVAAIALFFLNITTGQQTDIPRIEMMPNIPQPYDMRDWKTVAQKYDSLVFDLDATGQHLPLTTIIQNTVNYPGHPSFGIQSYVGTNSPPGREAINIIPAVVGATLSGIDKSNQFGYDWALMCEEFFNNRPEEYVYLNGPVASSGGDWWYETMPNVFFYQLNYLYPGTGDFDFQFTTVADRWLQAVKAMGGNDAPWEEAYMNYRAFSLSTMTPLETGVKEPEAAGAIGWILYNAYRVTGEEKYRKGAEWCLEFLDGWGSNPAYEIQLPYGAYAAARMNAELGTGYNVEKLVNWCFDITPLRQWGAVVEPWGGIDVHGLIGEARINYTGYAFNMNGTEQAGALVPMVRYDNRFARAIGKWTLNVANATRLYYSDFLPDDMEDNEDWTNLYDPHSVIAYEALREYPEGPFGTGDAMNGGWAQTNLGLYGSSHVGILGGIVKTTDVEGILQLDLLKTDYYRSEAYPSWLFYNPYNEGKTVTAEFPAGSFDLYDAISNQVIATNISGNTAISINADSPLLAVLIPAGATLEYELDKALVNDIVIDFSSGMAVENFPPRIKAVASSDTVFETGSAIDLYCAAEDKETSDLDYLWTLNEAIIGTAGQITYPAPQQTGPVTFVCTVEDEGGLKSVDSLTVEIVEFINYPPEIIDIRANRRYIEMGDTTAITCTATDPDEEPLFFEWASNGGTIGGNDSIAIFTAPGQQGEYEITCTVEDTSGLTETGVLTILVKDPFTNQSGELVASYEFNGNLLDNSGYGHHGAPTAIDYTEDFHGNDSKALSLPFSNSKVVVPNTDELNFSEGLTIAYWIYIDQFFDRESYPVSHGNWTTRWKTSLTEEKLRLTINGESGIVDLDSDSFLETGRWYHIAGIYDGSFCQVYIDGVLDAFSTFSGQINETAYDLVLGQSLPDQSGFDFDGSLDKLKVYNYGITPDKVAEIYENEYYSVSENTVKEPLMLVFPNPASDRVSISIHSQNTLNAQLIFYSSGGSTLYKEKIRIIKNVRNSFSIHTAGLPEGIYLVILKTENKLISRKINIIH